MSAPVKQKNAQEFKKKGSFIIIIIVSKSGIIIVGPMYGRPRWPTSSRVNYSTAVHANNALLLLLQPRRDRRTELQISVFSQLN